MEIAIAILLTLVTIALVGYPFLSYRKAAVSAKNRNHKQAQFRQDHNCSSKAGSQKSTAAENKGLPKQVDIDDIEEQIRNLRQKK